MLGQAGMMMLSNSGFSSLPLGLILNCRCEIREIRRVLITTGKDNSCCCKFLAKEDMRLAGIEGVNPY